MVKLLKLGLLPSEVEEHYNERFGPDVYQYKNIDVQGRAGARRPGRAHHASSSSPTSSARTASTRSRCSSASSRSIAQVKLYFKHYPITRAHPVRADGGAGGAWPRASRASSGSSTTSSSAAIRRRSRRPISSATRASSSSTSTRWKKRHRRRRRQGQPRSRRRREGQHRLDADAVHQRPQVPRPADLRRAERLDRRGAQQMKRASMRCGVVCLLSASVGAWPASSKGQHAPDFSLPTLKGGTVSLASLARQGRAHRLLGAVVRAVQKGAAAARQAGQGVRGQGRRDRWRSTSTSSATTPSAGQAARAVARRAARSGGLGGRRPTICRRCRPRSSSTRRASSASCTKASTAPATSTRFKQELDELTK